MTKTFFRDFLVCLFFFALGVILVSLVEKPKVETVTHIEYKEGKKDTLWLPGMVVHDTVHVKAKHVDTVGTDVVSFVDSCFQHDSSSVCVAVAHHSSPNFFDMGLDWNLRPRLIHQIDTLEVSSIITLPCERSFFQRFHVGIGYGATYLDNAVKLSPSVGIFYEVFP
jgi:hypothetical protein